MNSLERLVAWVASKCDGDWEHGAAFRLDMLDNPGWVLRVELPAGEWLDFATTFVDRTETDWVNYKCDGDIFEGCGGVGNLEEILNAFLEYVERGAIPKPSV